MSEIKVNKISQRSGTAITLGNSGTDFQLPSGADIVAQSGSTITIAAGATITNSGTATGFGQTYNGAVNWDTTPKTTTVTAASGVGYFINTTSGAVTVNLPVGVAGATIALADYANTWNINNVTINANGTEKIGGIAAPAVLNTIGQSVTFTYVDATQGWKNTQDSTSNETGNPFIIATGGTILTCGDYKTHVFTGPGSFVVSNTGPGSSSVEYLVVAGGGGGGVYGGGGGAGGYRTNFPSPTGVPISIQTYPITVGAGGTDCQPPQDTGIAGNNSIFSTIASTGGGGGRGYEAPTGGNGGSGGGGGASTVIPSNPGGSGNTPPVSPSQGNPGGTGNFGPRRSGGGGGGASTAGSTGPGPGPAGPGGPGTPIADALFGPTAPSYGTPGPAPGRWFAGGGGGYLQAISQPAAIPQGLGGTGGGGNGGNLSEPDKPSSSGTANTGGGGGGSAGSPGDGGSGIVVIRYKFQ